MLVCAQRATNRTSNGIHYHPPALREGRKTAMRHRRICLAALVLLALLTTTPIANAVITRLVPLREVLTESRYIVVARVELVDADKPATVLAVEEDLKKDKFPVRKVAINLTGDAEAKKDDHTGKMLKRLAPKLPVVLFIVERDGKYTAFGYTNGTWFQMIANKAADPEKTVFAFTHCEPYLTRTFKGTTEEMRKVVVDGLAGKKPPDPNPKEPPGFGPEVQSQEKDKDKAPTRSLQPGKDKQRPPAQFQADKKWIRVIAENGNGMVLSSPLVAGNRAYVGVAHGAIARYGVVYCIDLATQKTLWTFDAGGKMKQCYSSPFLADGRLYIGEGLHDDQNCKLYCIDAKTGKQVWEFATASHTEASPVVHGGRVYFGAGDDGVYCVDAASGKKVWQFTGPPKLHMHVDAMPAVDGKHVYIAGGWDEDSGQGDPLVCCVQADNGKLVWCQRTPAWLVKLDDKKALPRPVPAWGSPVVLDGVVYVGVGTGRVNTPSPAYQAVGGLMALNTASGQEAWATFKVGDGVLERAAVDSVAVYFGSRDGHCYCVDRKTGALRWKADLGSAVIATPALALDRGQAVSVFAVGSEGRIACLDAATGKAEWTFTDLEKSAPLLVSSPALSITTVGNGVERRLYFGACFNGLATPALCCLQDFQPAVNK
jgi:outer membrane protein assembly factor BamB